MSYIIGSIIGILVFALIVGFILASLYFLRHNKKVIKNIPESMKGGLQNAESKNEKERGGSGGGETGRKRSWFRRKQREQPREPSRDEGLDGQQHSVQVQPVVPFPEVERDSGRDTDDAKRNWPSFE